MTASAPFNSLVFFGDSLTDNGNLFAVTGGTTPQSPPYFNGRFSNGPTYAEIVPSLVGVTALNFAYGRGEAWTDGTEAPSQQFINLPSQLSQYFSSLPAAGVAPGTAAVLYIGNNDYLFLPPTATPTDVQVAIQSVLGSIATAAQQLVANGVEKILLLTLPSVAVTPFASELTPEQLAGAIAINAAHNAGLAHVAAGLAQAGVDVDLIDTARLADEIAADKETFGFQVTDQQLLLNPGADPERFAFWDSVHPTAAAHKVQAAFVGASMIADQVLLSDSGSGSPFMLGGEGSDLIFTGTGRDRVRSAGGDDTVFAGTGNDKVNSGHGNDLAAGGSGNDDMRGGSGTDLLAGNLGNDHVSGGSGSDALIAGGGRDRLNGDAGNDLFYFSEASGIARGSKAIGGAGKDVLMLDVSSSTFASSDFQGQLADLAHRRNGLQGCVDELGLSIHGIERLVVTVDGAEVIAIGGAATIVDATLVGLLDKADLWGLI